MIASKKQVKTRAEGSTTLVIVTVGGGFAAYTSLSVIGEVTTINKWLQDGQIWYYYGGDGELVKGWLQTGGKWYYLVPTNGAVATSKWINGEYYVRTVC